MKSLQDISTQRVSKIVTEIEKKHNCKFNILIQSHMKKNYRNCLKKNKEILNTYNNIDSITFVKEIIQLTAKKFITFINIFPGNTTEKYAIIREIITNPITKIITNNMPTEIDSLYLSIQRAEKNIKSQKSINNMPSNSNKISINKSAVSHKSHKSHTQIGGTAIPEKDMATRISNVMNKLRKNMTNVSDTS